MKAKQMDSQTAIEHWRDAARMLRAASRLMDKAAISGRGTGAMIRQAHTNIDAALVRMPTVEETKG